MKLKNATRISQHKEAAGVLINYNRIWPTERFNFVGLTIVTCIQRDTNHFECDVSKAILILRPRTEPFFQRRYYFISTKRGQSNRQISYVSLITSCIVIATDNLYLFWDKQFRVAESLFYRRILVVLKYIIAQVLLSINLYRRLECTYLFLMYNSPLLNSAVIMRFDVKICRSEHVNPVANVFRH